MVATETHSYIGNFCLMYHCLAVTADLSLDAELQRIFTLYCECIGVGYQRDIIGIIYRIIDAKVFIMVALCNRADHYIFAL